MKCATQQKAQEKTKIGWAVDWERPGVEYEGATKRGRRLETVSIEERKMREGIRPMGNERIWMTGHVVEQVKGLDLEKPGPKSCRNEIAAVARG